MKKFYFILTLMIVLLLSGCGEQQNITPKDPVVEDDNWEPDQSLICSYICEYDIPEMCADDIAEMQEQWIDMDESIMDSSSCQLMCEADWTEDTIACVSDADRCAQLLNEAPYCIDDTVETDLSDYELPSSCYNACKNYTYCVAYGDDVTSYDMDQAYLSCLQICGAWDSQTRKCVANTAIRQPSDCAAQSACVLKDVRNLMNR